MTDLAALERRCEDFVATRTAADPAHDLAHIKRVVTSTRYLSEKEGADVTVSVPAAWLHDCVQVRKDSPDRARASTLAAREAVRFLRTVGYPEDLLPRVAHAVEAHSFSAGIPVRSLEAAVVQDADRLDALGAIGVARCVLTGGALGSALYHPQDPFCRTRAPDDAAYVVDHFYAKLFRLPAMMQTAAGREEAERRVEAMRDFLAELARETGTALP